MTAKQLRRIAVMACIEFLIFGGFSDILYLECITFTIVLFALAFQRHEAILAAIVFAILNMALRQGVAPWSLMYLLIYPSYTLVVSLLKKVLQDHFVLTVILCGFLSFLTGQLVQIPFLLVSKKITALYLIAGLKTSLIQGVLSAMTCAFLLKPCYRVLRKIEGRENE